MIGTQHEPSYPRSPWHMAWAIGGAAIVCRCPRTEDHESWVLDPILDAQTIPST